MNPTPTTADNTNGTPTPSPNSPPPSSAPTAFAAVSAVPTVPAARPRWSGDTALMRKALIAGSANAAAVASTTPTPITAGTLCSSG